MTDFSKGWRTDCVSNRACPWRRVACSAWRVAGAGPAEVAIAVEDSGTGLDPEVRRRLFEPYFSTKSSGTGLGLAIVRRAVEAHQGRIEVRSELGQGTSIRIVLPRVGAA